MLETSFSSVTGFIQQTLDPILLRFVPTYKVQPGCPQFRRSSEVRPPDWESSESPKLTPRPAEPNSDMILQPKSKNKQISPHWPEPDDFQSDQPMESGIWFTTSDVEENNDDEKIDERPLYRRNAKKYVRREKDDFQKKIESIMSKENTSMPSTPLRQIYMTVSKPRIPQSYRNRPHRGLNLNNIVKLEPIPEHSEMIL